MKKLCDLLPMKPSYSNFSISLLLLFSVACNQGEESKKTNRSEVIDEFKNFQTDNYDWLIGHWKRINEASTKSTYELWTKLNDGHYQGYGYTLKGKDTLWQENMQFKKVADQWAMEVESPGNDTAVIFRQFSASDTSFVVQNLQHDFPTSIQYWRDDDLLEATVANSSKQILYTFKPFQTPTK